MALEKFSKADYGRCPRYARLFIGNVGLRLGRTGHVTIVDHFCYVKNRARCFGRFSVYREMMICVVVFVSKASSLIVRVEQGFLPGAGGAASGRNRQAHAELGQGELHD